MNDHRDTTKPRPLFRRHVRRPRLTSLLDRSTAQAILLTAPAGYGKTTLAQEWLQGRDHAVWYHATSASADLAAFSTDVADVVAPIVPGAGDRLRQRLRVGEVPEKAARPLAELMAEDLAAWPEGARLVIDDYHFVMDSAPVEEFADWLLTLAPVRLLVTSRRRPGWASARRVLYGEVMEIGPDQLALNDEEAGHILSDRSDEAVRTLVRQAEGWPALIGLASLSATLDLPEEKVSDALFRYFAEEVLRREPPEVQRFMLLASIPAGINTRIAQDVLGFEDSDSILDHLRTEDLLHDAGEDEFRFHPLLREFLQRKLKSEDGLLFQDRCAAVLSWARAMARWDEALALARVVGSPILLAEVVGEAATELVASGRVETIEKWLAHCGSAGFVDPGAVLARAEIAVRRGRFSEAAGLAKDLVNRLPLGDPNLARAWNTIGQAHILQSNYTEALACHLEARKHASKEADLTQALWGAFLSASELELETADSLLSEFQEVVPRDATGQLRLGSGRQIAATHSGSFAGIWPSLEPLMSLATTEADPMAASNFLANAACVNVGRGDYQLAKSLAERGVKFCVDLRLDFATAFCLVQLAAADIGLGSTRSAEMTLAELSTTAARHEDPWLRAAMRTLEIRLALAKGEVDLAASLCSQALDPVIPPAPRGEYLGVSAIALAAAGLCHEARERAREALSATRTIEAVYYSRYGVFIADISQRKTSSTLARIGHRLIHESQAADFLDALVLSYRASPTLLKWLAEQSGIEDALTRALEAANDGHIARSIGLDLRHPTPEPQALAQLTPREREVLEHLAKGLSNEEIAKRLFISLSTAKVHVHHILEKFGVRTRLQAVLKAQELLRMSD